MICTNLRVFFFSPFLDFFSFGLSVQYYCYATTQNDTLDWMSARGEERNKHTGEADKSAKCAKCHKQGKQLGESLHPPQEKGHKTGRKIRPSMPEDGGGG